MTEEMMNLRALVEKTPDADLLREMIGFAAHRLMELEVRPTGRTRIGSRNATAIATAPGRRGPARSSCVSRSCARARIFRAFSSRAGSPRRPSRRSCRKPTCTASGPARSTIWSRPWG